MRIAIVLCVSADGSLPVTLRYIAHSAKPRCFRDHQFDEYKAKYSFHENEENFPNALIEQNDTEQLYEDIFVNGMLSQVQLHSNELLPDLGEVRSVNEFAPILNSESPEYASLDRSNIAHNLLQSVYDERHGNAVVSDE